MQIAKPHPSIDNPAGLEMCISNASGQESTFSEIHCSQMMVLSLAVHENHLGSFYNATRLLQLSHIRLTESESLG